MSLESILEAIRSKLEEGIKQQLSGLRGLVVKPVYNSMMPLRVELALPSNVSELVFLKDGQVNLSREPLSNVDVRIQTDAETLRTAFNNPSAELFEKLEAQGKISITSLTKKGSEAEGYIRKHLAG